MINLGKHSQTITKMRTGIIFALAVIVLVTAVGGCAPEQELVYYRFSDDFRANSYILAYGDEAVVIDTASPAEIVGTLREKKLKLKAVILTHGHFDHIAGAEDILAEFPEAAVMVHPGDRKKLADPVGNLSTMFGYNVSVKVESEPLTGDDSIIVGGRKIEVLETPGHSEGSICLKADKFLFSGDTLFQGAVGRTDFPGSNPRDLRISLRKLVKLPDDTVILPGHGDSSTIGAEKKNLSFLIGEEE